MKCNQVCEWNGYGQAVHCFKPDGAVCLKDAARSPAAAIQTAKADAGKLQLHLVPMQIVRDICEVREYGNRKYGDPNNWRQVELMRYVDALLRHTLAFAEDIYSVDEESGIPHYKHMECNLAFISQLIREGKCPPRSDDKQVQSGEIF